MKHVIGKQYSPPPASPANQPPAPSPFGGVDAQAVIADFARRLADLEGAMKLTVPSDRVISQIVLTKDTALITADKIAMVGEVTFADWHRDVTGQATGAIDPSITQIRGGTIRTGKVASLSGNAYLDLDAIDTSPFLYASTGIAVYGNGHFRLGPSGSKNLVWDGSNLKVDGAALLGSTAVSTVVTGAAMGAAYPGDFTGSILSNSGTAITMNSSQLFRSGSGNAGVFVGAGGIYGKDSVGATTFAIDGSTGAATFAGTITGSTIQGTTNINSAGYISASGIAAVNNGSILGYTGSAAIFGQSNAGVTNQFNSALFGYNGYTGSTGIGSIGVAGVVNSLNGNTSAMGVFGYAASGTGVYGFSDSTSGIGVVGKSSSSAGTGLIAVNDGGGNAFHCNGKMIKTGTELVSNLNADMLDGYHANTLPIDMSQISIGSTGTKFQYSTDNLNWTNIYLKRANW